MAEVPYRTLGASPSPSPGRLRPQERPGELAAQHGFDDVAHFVGLEGLRDQGSAPELLRDHRQVAVARQEAERDAPLHKYVADRKAEATVEVDVEDGALERCLASINQAGIQPGGGPGRLEAPLCDESAND